jgi:hypothetical protein
MNNPFEFKYPDDIDPQDVVDLFVPVFGEYYNVPKSGHTFINGARGSGKSMMFRFMKPDCQMLVDNNGKRRTKPKKLQELDYFSIYIPIKKGHLDKTDIRLNDQHGESLLNEHFMVTQFSLLVIKELSDAGIENNKTNVKALQTFYKTIFCSLLDYAGCTVKETSVSHPKTVTGVFASMTERLKQITSEFQHGYIKQLIGQTGPVPYNGPILLYSEFLFEFLREFRKLPFMPDKPIFLLIDDADELNIVQRKILNSWVALRTSKEVSLKISTQLKYKVFSTINGSRIDTPHDYSDVNLNDIYTTKKNVYFKRIHEIVTKRLQKYKFKNTEPEVFFPPDKTQQVNIESIKQKYERQQLDAGQSEKQAYDFAYRYAIPDFIRDQIKGNRYTYSYAGFEQLVNISSGIIREFIDFASEMYVAQVSDRHGSKTQSIDSRIQDREIRKYSDKKIESEFDKYREESDKKHNMDKLRHLILGMGGLFKLILLSNASERRVFSIALNDEPDEELKEVLELGVQHGYLQKSLIGNKYGTGKSRLYILNRILAPHFQLDPTSFAGYKFMDSSTLKRALTDHEKFIDSFRDKLNTAEKKEQITLFDEEK